MASCSPRDGSVKLSFGHLVLCRLGLDCMVVDGCKLWRHKFCVLVIVVVELYYWNFFHIHTIFQSIKVPEIFHICIGLQLVNDCYKFSPLF